MRVKTLSTEFKTFALLVPFFVVVAAVYAYFTDPMEWVGIVGLSLTACLCAFIAGFIWLTSRKVDDRPEDNELGEISDAATDNYGFFSPHSWWPLWLGLSSAVVFLGVAIGWWLVMIAAPFMALATVGWTFEYFRGEKAV
ncbi:cytochrome c oxidase subunit 4 [Ornithinicoccus hortensis]|uniref:Cytochrome c oxidase polypeptide 4 n=1 Tax=Ornithinicoccus hortensis TaxID=82346 RepID=A0A542YRE2_9MICO|nr:cytochrome c oxidase subunit 4 [Ornithinicoccus hortensis]TQL50617.1 cytochrome c oxidase subunit IV [Ornithinicoccus hortensis]